MRKMVDGLREVAPVEGFIDDSPGYLSWLSCHDRGWVLNMHRSSRPARLVLRRVTCRHVSGTHGRMQTTQDPKLCGTDRRALEVWAHREVGERPSSGGAC